MKGHAEALHYALGAGLQRGVGVLLLPVATRVLSPHQYGEFVLVQIIGTVLWTVVAFGLPAATFRFLADAERPGREELGYTVRVVAISETVVISSAAAVALWTGHPTAAWSALYCGSLLLWFPALYAAQALGRPRPYFALSVGVPLVAHTAALVGGGVAASLWTPTYVVASLGSALVAILWVPSRRAAAGILRSESLTLLRFGAPLIPHFVALWAIGGSDRLFLARYHGVAVVGMYSIAYSVASGVLMLVSGYVTLGNRDRINRSSGALRYREGALLGLLAGEFIWLFFRPVASALLPAAYVDSDATRIIALVVAASVSTVAYQIANASFFVNRRTSRVALITVVGGLATLALNGALIPEWAAVGAAWATYLGSVATAGVAMRAAWGMLGQAERESAVTALRLAALWLGSHLAVQAAHVPAVFAPALCVGICGAWSSVVRRPSRTLDDASLDEEALEQLAQDGGRGVDIEAALPLAYETFTNRRWPRFRDQLAEPVRFLRSLRTPYPSAPATSIHDALLVVCANQRQTEGIEAIVASASRSGVATALVTMGRPGPVDAGWRTVWSSIGAGLRQALVPWPNRNGPSPWTVGWWEARGEVRRARARAFLSAGRPIAILCTDEWEPEVRAIVVEARSQGIAVCQLQYGIATTRSVQYRASRADFHAVISAGQVERLAGLFGMATSELIVTGHPRLSPPKPLAPPSDPRSVVLVLGQPRLGGLGGGWVGDEEYWRGLGVTIELLRSTCPGSFAVRYRPHPDERSWAEHTSRLGWEGTGGGSLWDDLEGADLVVTIDSTAALQAQTAGRHVIRAAVEVPGLPNDLPVVADLESARLAWVSPCQPGPMPDQAGDAVLDLILERCDALAGRTR